MAARDENRAREAIRHLEEEGTNDGTVEWLKLDLSDPRLAVRSAKELLEKETRLDILGERATSSWYMNFPLISGWDSQ